MPRDVLIDGHFHLTRAKPRPSWAIFVRQASLGACLIVGACQARSCSLSATPAIGAKVTTAPEIAVGNLQAQIDEQQRAHDRSPEALQFTTTLVGLLETRAQFFSRLSDYDRSLELAEAAVRRAPNDSAAFLLRAGARSALHQFSLALAEIEQATSLGASADQTERLRATILEAQGSPRALEIWRSNARWSSEITARGALAVAEGENGNLAEAERLFAEAVEHYRDVSPFPLAWIEFQQGLMWERAGDLTRARKHYESARAYLPQYATATGHLASVMSLSGDAAKAAELLRPLADTSEDPDYAADLANVLDRLGQWQEARKYRASAQARFEKLLARYPEAFADHAAEAWLADDSRKALALARQNLANRKTADAFNLAISAALAAQESSLACQLASEAMSALRSTARLRSTADRAFSACGQVP